jgi:hypothetical protein
MAFAPYCHPVSPNLHARQTLSEWRTARQPRLWGFPSLVPPVSKPLLCEKSDLLAASPAAFARARPLGDPCIQTGVLSATKRGTRGPRRSEPGESRRSTQLSGMAEKSQSQSTACSKDPMNEGQVSGSHFKPSIGGFVGGYRRRLAYFTAAARHPATHAAIITMLPTASSSPTQVSIGVTA